MLSPSRRVPEACPEVRADNREVELVLYDLLVFFL